MVDVIQGKHRKPPSFLQSVLGGVAEATPGAVNQYFQNRNQQQQNQLQSQEAQRKEQSELARQMQLQQQKYEYERQLKGMDLAGKRQEQQQKMDLEANEKLAPFQAGLETLQQMRELRNKGNIGFGSSFTGVFNPETRKDRAAYQTLGNSLISLASTIPIRNKSEFETLTGLLNDPSITLDEMDGVLDSLERIITQNMQQFQSGQSEDGQTSHQKKLPKHLAKNQYDLEELSIDSAKQYKGRVVEDDEGNRYRSNGKKWIKE